MCEGFMSIPVSRWIVRRIVLSIALAWGALTHAPIAHAQAPVPAVGLYWKCACDPTAGSGVSAPLNQLLFRTDTASIYYKSGAANTAWTQLGVGGGGGGGLPPDGNYVDIDVTGAGTTWTINNGVVTLVKMANLAQSTVIGRGVGAGTGSPQALSSAQVTAVLDNFTSLLRGTVPASGGGTVNYLRADGTFAAPPGAGDITDVTAGTNLNGGGSSGNVTLNVNPTVELAGVASPVPTLTLNNDTLSFNRTSLLFKANGVTADCSNMRWADSANALKWSMGNDATCNGSNNFWLYDNVNAKYLLFADNLAQSFLTFGTTDGVLRYDNATHDWNVLSNGVLRLTINDTTVNSAVALQESGNRVFSVAGDGLSSSAATVEMRQDCATDQLLSWSGADWICTTPAAGITNGAGSNVLPKSNGTNLIASTVRDDGTTVQASPFASIYTAGNNINGWAVSSDAGGDVFIDAKTFTGDTIQFRNGVGAQSASANLWMEVEDTAVTFPGYVEVQQTISANHLQVGGQIITYDGSVSTPTASAGTVEGDSGSVAGRVTSIGAVSTTITFQTFSNRTYCVANPAAVSVVALTGFTNNTATFSCYAAATGIAANCPDLTYHCFGN